MSIPGSGERKPVVMLTSSAVCVLCFTVCFSSFALLLWSPCSALLCFFKTLSLVFPSVSYLFCSLSSYFPLCRSPASVFPPPGFPPRSLFSWFGFSSGFYSQRTQAFLGNGRRASRWRETCPLPRLKRLHWWRSFTVKTVADEDDEQLSRKRRRFQIQRTFPVWSLDVFCNFVIKPPDKL